MKTWDDPHLATVIRLARDEDLGDGDLSAALMSNPNEWASFTLLAKQAGVFAGREVAPAVVQAYDPAIEIDWADRAVDGARLDEGTTELAVIRGPVGPVLSLERVLLNFLQRLAGIATLTRRFVDAVGSTPAAIYDTRKTTPGWRALEKYAVRCGGGKNHRQGLFDAVLIKDNHLAGIPSDRLAPTVFDMLNRLSAVKPAFVEVEVDSLDQFESLLSVVGIHAILLDNFALDDLRRAVALRDDYGLRGKVELEASGGIVLETVRLIAATGVDRISVGSLTHSAAALDMAMERV
jgi:nicotinate-nucleotide pyrophosphorylase (carboxylating)